MFSSEMVYTGRNANSNFAFQCFTVTPCKALVWTPNLLANYLNWVCLGACRLGWSDLLEWDISTLVRTSPSPTVVTGSEAETQEESDLDHEQSDLDEEEILLQRLRPRGQQETADMSEDSYSTDGEDSYTTSKGSAATTEDEEDEKNAEEQAGVAVTMLDAGQEAAADAARQILGGGQAHCGGRCLPRALQQELHTSPALWEEVTARGFLYLQRATTWRDRCRASGLPAGESSLQAATRQRLGKILAAGMFLAHSDVPLLRVASTRRVSSLHFSVVIASAASPVVKMNRPSSGVSSLSHQVRGVRRRE